MSRSLFGTDGVRGRANSEPMTAEIAMRIGMAAGQVFKQDGYRNRAVIGKDTRLSGYMIEQALTAGFLSVGVDVLLLGPIPTPAVGFLTRSMRADMGVMISASHNAYEDNGIKLFGPDGFKLSDAVEDEIEALVLSPQGMQLAASRAIGRARRLDDVDGRYIEAVKASAARGLDLTGLKIVVDCANGAAYKVAPTVLWELGAEVIPIAVTPDGFNINGNCGSTHPALLQEHVVAHQADVGIALDGDADRVVMVCEHGRLVDGDQLMATIADQWKRDGRLTGGGVVATVMSNLGLERYLGTRKMSLVRTQVGDRYVLERMRADGFNLGGEQSGHIIMTDHATTGDGLMAALQALSAMIKVGKPASETFRAFEPVPQLLKNVRVVDADAAMAAASVMKAIAAAEARLGKSGRILVRKSGTEPLIRVMAEGDDSDLVRTVVDQIIEAIPPAGGMKGRVLIVAGSDSGGGAGIQADIKAVTAMDGFAATAITALTAQNTEGVHGVVTVDPAFIAQQIEVVLSDIGADALKTGMLHSAEVIETVAAAFRKHAPDTPLVVDPVMIAKGGHRLLLGDAEAALRDVLLPMAALLTPNLPEAEALAGFPVRTEAEMRRAAEHLARLGPKAILMKGGHLEGDRVIDLLFHEGRFDRFEDARIKSRHTHGTGCTLASAIAAGLAQKMSLKDSVVRARAYVRAAIETAPGFGRGHGPLNHAVTVKPH